jgi:MFS family permease
MPPRLIQQTVLAEPNFRRFFVGHAISLLGDGMVGVALSFAVLDLTKSPADLGYVMSARSVSLVAALLLGGAVADRLPRRRVMISADLTRFLGQAITAALLISGHARIWELIALQAVHGTATSTFTPAVTGLMPSIAASDRLQQANAFRGVAISTGTIIGPAIAGAIVVVTSPGWAIAADALTFGISATQLVRLKVPAHKLPSTQSFLRDLLDGWYELRSRTWLWAFISFASLNNMFYATFLVLGPVVAIRSHGGPMAWATLVTALAVGSLLGGAAVLRIRPRQPMRTAALATVFFSTPTIGLAAHLPVTVLVCLCLFAGAGATMSNVLTETTLQHHVEETALSRISSFELFGSLAAQPIGQTGTGPIAANIGIYPALWIAGTGQLVSALATLTIPAIRRVSAHPGETRESRIKHLTR